MSKMSMANLKKVQSKRELKRIRYFSEDFKRSKVKELEENITTPTEISKVYGCSVSAVYLWIYKYSNHLKKGTRQVVEMDSDTKKIEKLKQKIRELERIVGQKQLQIDFQDKLIELTNKEVGFDVKKKFGSKLSFGSGSTEQDTVGE